MFNGSLSTVTVAGVSGKEFLARVNAAQEGGAFSEASEARGAFWTAVDSGEGAQEALNLLLAAEAAIN